MSLIRPCTESLSCLTNALDFLARYLLRSKSAVPDRNPVLIMLRPCPVHARNPLFRIQIRVLNMVMPCPGFDPGFDDYDPMAVPSLKFKRVDEMDE